jgi:RNA polymerase sigma-70 factor, ECF subfamily
MHSHAETEFFTRCRRGDARAWDELFNWHYASTGRFVFQLAPDFTREDVEEICQETFLSVIRGLDQFDGRSQFQTWLFRIAANKARDYRERQHAAKRGSGRVPLSLHAEDPETGLAIDPASPAATPDDVLLTFERMALLREALDQLGPPCREIIELRYFGDLTYEEIGASLNLHIKTVSSRLSKCLDRLEVLVRKTFSGKKPAPSSV